MTSDCKFPRIKLICILQWSAYRVLYVFFFFGSFVSIPLLTYNLEFWRFLTLQSCDTVKQDNLLIETVKKHDGRNWKKIGAYGSNSLGLNSFSFFWKKKKKKIQIAHQQVASVYCQLWIYLKAKCWDAF